MLRRLALGLALVGAALSPRTARGQDLRTQIRTNLFTFGTCGEPLCLSGSLAGHGLHFIPATQSAAANMLDLLGNALAASVSNTPVSATSSGVTYEFVGGLPVKTSTSGGAIFGERAQTLGRGRFFVGGNVTAMHFERLRGVRMDGIVFNFTHQDIPPLDSLGNPGFENDVVRVQVAMNINLIISTLVMSYGLVDGVDISVAVPVVHTAIQGRSVATILPATYPTPHFFATNPDGSLVLTAVSTIDGSKTGIGDVAARVKINFAQGKKVGVAFLADARFPTGDQNNFLGAGAFSARGLGIVSAKFGTIAPHLNLGYVFRDAALSNSSIVATAGFDNSLAPWATMAFDLLSEWQLGASKFKVPGPVEYNSPYLHEVTPTNIPEQRDDFLSASVGFKFQTQRGILLVTNAFFPLRNSGLQPSVVWTGGLEYNF
jgi:hypothetical protein